ncbi:MAG TPA: GNAT family N-acetyltransferase [Acidimicrobiales bacterium]|nr:GNAT family N-acetyltransferase [Acidimicrobiales bacterium]
MKLHDASPGDDEVAARIWWRCDRDPDEPFPDDPLAWDHLRHLRETGRMVMASIDGRPAGFGGIVVRSGVTRLADLFVDPDHQGRGVGKALLAELLDGASVMTTSASTDPRALPLYVRAGMRPLWPYHFLFGDPRSVAPPSSVTIEAADSDELVDIDRAATGFDRATDHEYYEVGCRAQPLRIVSEGRAIGFTYLEPPQPWAPNRWILLTLAVVPGHESGDALRAALAYAGAQGASALFTAVPGPNPVLASLLDDGFVIPEQDIFMATSPDLVDPLRHHYHPGFG